MIRPWIPLETPDYSRSSKTTRDTRQLNRNWLVDGGYQERGEIYRAQCSSRNIRRDRPVFPRLWDRRKCPASNSCWLYLRRGSDRLGDQKCPDGRFESRRQPLENARWTGVSARSQGENKPELNLQATSSVPMLFNSGMLHPIMSIAMV